MKIDKLNDNNTPIIHFHIYRNISRCTVHSRLSPQENIVCQKCACTPDPIVKAKVYTRKNLVMLETSIDEFHKSYYMMAIQKLAFHFPHMCILVTHNCGKTHIDAIKYSAEFQYLSCRCYYTERVVASFSAKFNMNIMMEIYLYILR